MSENDTKQEIVAASSSLATRYDPDTNTLEFTLQFQNLPAILLHLLHDNRDKIPLVLTSSLLEMIMPGKGYSVGDDVPINAEKKLH